MSANAEIVRRIYAEGLLDGRVEALLELAAPDVEYVNPPDAVEPGVRRGYDELRVAAQASQETFVGAEHRLRQIFDGGDRVVAAVTFHARGRESGAAASHDEAHTWTFRDGKVVRFEWGRDLSAALAAAGLEGQDPAGLSSPRSSGV